MFCYLASHKLHDAELLLQQCLETVSLPDSRCLVQIRFFLSNSHNLLIFYLFHWSPDSENFWGISHLILGCERASHFVGTVPSRLFFFHTSCMVRNFSKCLETGSRFDHCWKSLFCLQPDFHLANITDFANTIEREKECKTYHQQMNDYMVFVQVYHK